MNDDEARLQAKIKELSERFIARSSADLGLMQTSLLQAQNGDAEAIQQLLLLAHRISGSGAMLGFAAVSGCARNIEGMLRTNPHATDIWQQIDVQLKHLDIALGEAQRTPAS